MTKLNVKPKIDVAFKKIFSDNKEILKILLSHALKTNFNKIEILSPEITPHEADEKFCRLDVRATVDGKEIDIEIQLGEREDYRARTVYYWSLLFGSLKKGKQYNEIPTTICVNFVNFEMFGSSDFHSVFRILETSRHEVLTDKAEWHFFELNKIPSFQDVKDDPLIYWLNFINAETEEEIQALESIPDEALQSAIIEVKKLNKDETFVNTVLRRIQAIEEEESAIGAAKEVTEQKTKITLAKKFLKRGIDIEIVSEETGLNVNFLKKILAEDNLK
jgi:predicted transposase/invertase (TIGR01784 family)